MKYKIIAVDMDGTLLDDNKEISKENLAAIEKLKKAGVKFVICSGRIPSGLRYYLSSVSKGQAVISCNGGVILDDDHSNIIYESPMDKQTAHMIVEMLREEGDPYFHLYDGDIQLSEKFEHGSAYYHKFSLSIPREFRMELRIIPDALKYIREESSSLRKFVVVDKDLEFIKKLKEKFRKISSLEVTSSAGDNIEIMRRRVNKGNGLKILAEYLGYSLENCIAVGNDENDITMIRNAGLGVAVSNATDFVKESADFITRSDNNGAWMDEILEKFM